MSAKAASKKGIGVGKLITPPMPLHIDGEKPSTWWDKPGMAEQVDEYWRNSPDEVAHRQRLAKLVEGYCGSGTSKVLEVGCGTGLVYEALSGLRMAYTGIDYSAKMLDIAKRRYPRVTFRGGNAEAIDYAAGWFDIAVAFEVFGHMADYSKALAELIRVAAKTAIFTVWLGGKERTLGGDHYEEPLVSVMERIALALNGQKASVTVKDMGYSVAAFVIEKVDNG